MPFRPVILSFAVLVCLGSAIASAQNGQGANANPSATPSPARPASSGALRPGGSNQFNVLQQYPVQQPTLPPDSIQPPGNGVTPPRIVKSVAPSYTSAAMREKIEGTVQLQAVVRPDGTLADITIAKSLDRTFGLDQAALDAAKKWLFEPGTKDGKAVPVRITLQMDFRLRGSRAAQRPLQAAGDQFQLAPSASTTDPDFEKGVYKLTDPGIVGPKVKAHADPSYTPPAMQAKIQAVVAHPL